MLKRFLDVVSSVAGVVVISPLLMALALAIWFFDGAPVLFRQVRAGRYGAPFTIYKFRTMKAVHGPDGQELSDAHRLTSLGRFLRSTSLDELPELFNVLKGDMSLVGPRPLLLEYLALYDAEQARRHEVRPGITGWAQVNGRNAVTWDAKFKMDVWYVDHQSLWLDLSILMRTAVRVFLRDGINQPGQETAEKFRGQRH
jgi:sugar transferase EpsL